jgi:hypothetical protein
MGLTLAARLLRRRKSALALFQRALLEQLRFEAVHPVPYGDEQRRAAVAQRWERLLHEAGLGRRLPRGAAELLSELPLPLKLVREVEAPEAPSVPAP